MAPKEGNPAALTLKVTATIEPSSPAAYCRTLPTPLGGGGPGLYVDFSTFCFQMPMTGFGVGSDVGAWASREQAINAKTVKAKLRFIETSMQKALQVIDWRF